MAAQLPADIPVYRVEEIDVKAAAATRLLEKAEYLITVAASESVYLSQWQTWIEAVKATEEIYWEKTTKSGKKTQVNLRDRLFGLAVESQNEDRDNSVIVRYIGSCRNDGTLLQAEQVIYMLEQVAQQELQLLHVHRQQMILRR